MLVGMMGARFLASISMILFGLNALWDVHPRRWLRRRWWMFGLLWVLLYALSCFWSADTGEWFSHLQVKFPFLFMPLAFAFLPPFTARQLRAFTACLALLMCAGAIYSLSFLWTASDDLIISYKYAQVLPTPIYDDHIAFSSLVALTIGWAVFYHPYLPQRRERIAVLLLALFLAVYLHVLAAKTGMVALYILLAGVIAYHIRRAPKKGLLFLAAAIAAISAAFIVLPTLRERAGYTMVTWRSYVMGERTGIYSDAGRMISYDLAVRSIARHPFAGVGAGDVFTEMKRGYARWYPEVPEAQQLWPHNQFLTTALAVGIPGAVLFFIWIAAPLRHARRSRAGFYFILTWLMLMVPLMVDVFLEVQFGVAVYLTFLLWQRKAMIDLGKQAPQPD
jgi:O-antigen ligase